ncbi:MAG TPA: PD-(D/E)XK nuclease family protein [Rubrivivax sp.]
MAPTHTTRIDASLAPTQVWARVAEITADWVARSAIPLRDVLLLVPFVQLIEPARRAFATRGGWQPRIETTATLASALAPPGSPGAGQLSGSPVLDALTLAQMLRGLVPLAGWDRREPRLFSQLVQASVRTAHELARAAACQTPLQRPAWWAAAERHLVEAAGPGALESALCRVAFEWARDAPAPASDALFGARPAAWVSVQAGGVDPLVDNLLVAAECPSLVIDSDVSSEDPFAAVAAKPPPRLVVADGLEGEARATAAEVIAALNAGLAPVALIALDRVLSRRVRALLERQHVALVDETGWTLSTTRAAARVMALLRAARHEATADERLEWLKGGESALAQPLPLQRLERHLRAGRDPATAGDSAAAALWAEAAATLAPLRPSGRLTLAAWLQALSIVLERTGAAAALRADAAGAQLVAALRIAPEWRDDVAWAAALQGELLDSTGFADWVDRTLEAENFVPPATAGAEVALTPLARAVLRPFSAVVVAGADERHLGAVGSSPGLLPDTVAAALGIDTPTSALQREQLSLAQLLRVPDTVFLHRRLEGDEPVGASPALDAMKLARRNAGEPPIEDAAPSLTQRVLSPSPVLRPAPVAIGALPQRLSASAVESLRACPYQFFSRSVLGLREADELDQPLGKRDYGTWLHAVLHRFHGERAQRGADAGDDRAALNAVADAVEAEMGIAPERLLPYRASFEHLIAPYIVWLQGRDARGLRWLDGERAAERAPPELDGVRLQGRIDRIDIQGATLELIDYKTGSVQRLRDQVRDPLEDTQLAFYALLLDADLAEPGSVSAGYLALDAKDAPLPVLHAEVADSARALLRGMADDLRRLRSGAGLPALGEGRTCDFCEARGLCRRDHWADAGVQV